MEFKTWLLYAFTDFMVCITPGPAVILVSTQALKYSSKHSFFGALGISAGSFIYFVLSAFGLSALILAAGQLFEYIKYAGALYLIVNGGIIIYKSYKKQSEINIQVKDTRYFKLFIQGLITEIANPNAILFFVALLPLFINPKKDIGLQFGIFGLSTIIMETLILVGYGFITHKSKKLVKQNSMFTKLKDHLSGLALIGIDLNLFFIKRSFK